MDEILIRSLLVGGGLAVAAGLLGVFLLWRRMAYFGDALSHSALLGVALGLILGMWESVWVWLVCSMVAGVMVWVQHERHISSDTMLGILGHSALAFGLLAISLNPVSTNISLESYLFGDILLLQQQDVYLALGLCIVVAIVMYAIWPALVLMSVHQELAQAEGVNTRLLGLVYMLLLALVVALAMKVVGIFLMTSLLIIPAAAARQLSRTPEQMVLITVIFGVMATWLGILFSWLSDVPAGSMIVVTATLIFVTTQFIKRRK